MSNAIRKDIRRQIVRNPRRFIAIFLIVALGVAFYSGVRATSPDMQLTVDAYFDECRASDVRLVSTLGFDEADVAALRETEGVQTLMSSYSVDGFLVKNETSLLITFQSLDFEKLAAHPDDILNQPSLTEGRLPQAADECLLDESMRKVRGYALGDTITIDTQGDEDITDSLSRLQYTVVGFARSVQYIAFDRGNSKKGNGSINAFVLLPEQNFTMDVYTQVFVKADSLPASRFTQDYDVAVKAFCDRLTAVADRRAPERLQSIRADANVELDKGKQELEQAKAELSDAEQKLLDGEQKLREGEQQLKDSRAELDGKIADGQRQLDEAKAQLDQAAAVLQAKQDELDAGRETLTQAQQKLAQTKATLEQSETALSQLGSQIEQLKAALAQLPQGSEQAQQVSQKLAQAEQTFAAQRAGLDAAWKQYNDGIQDTSAKQAELEAGSDAMGQARADFTDRQQQYETGCRELETSRTQGERRLADAQNELDSSRQTLEDARSEYDNKHPEALQKITDAERKLADSEQQLAELEQPEWYILDLDKNAGFAGFEQDTDRIAAIGLVFPLIFFLVAALVSLTNMTRMVEDDRTEIGVLKALGYSRLTIASKYLVYSGLAAVSGAALGIVVGARLFPVVIVDAYGILYSLPFVLTPINVQSAAQAGVGALLCAVLPAFLVCQKELLSTPASLMRPRSPKDGKRILLERLPVVWKHFNFSQKVTCRNIFRYKKRLFMTVIGIAGCTALVFTAFGLKDSIRMMVPIQYDEIQKYDMLLSFKEDMSISEQQELQALVRDSKPIAADMLCHKEYVDVSGKGKTYSTNLIVPQDDKAFTQFISLRDRLSGQTHSLSDDGVVITEKLSRLINVHAGDMLTFLDTNNKTLQVKVTAVTENYVYHYMYMTPELYVQLYGSEPVSNALFGQLSDTSEEAENALSASLLQCDSVSSVSFNTNVRARFDDMISALNFVVLVLLVSAAALAFVVLFNLTNINIDERKRELATLKVLGFYDGETAMYLYRESIILTIFGILAGLVLGVFLLFYVISTAEVDIVMFTRRTNWINYVYSALITAGFAAVVNVIMIGVIRRIDMVESLKSVE